MLLGGGSSGIVGKQLGKSGGDAEDDRTPPGGVSRAGRMVDAKWIAARLSISVRHAERLMTRGEFGPPFKLGHRTTRVQRAGVDLFLRRAELPYEENKRPGGQGS